MTLLNKKLNPEKAEIAMEDLNALSRLEKEIQDIKEKYKFSKLDF
ncbi:MAG: hypothetical protein ABI554_12480 [Flavobacterium sp.]